jgi:hypothetical protein
MPEPESDGSDIRRISEPAGKIAIPKPIHIERELGLHLVPK